MERHVGLARTAPLLPTSTLKRGEGLAQRRFSVIDRDGAPVLPFRYSTLNPVSDKRKAENRERAKMADRLWPKRREGTVMCVFPDCGRPADDLHEPKFRSRLGSITDEENAAPVCRQHHRWIHDHPAEAEKIGLAVNSWK